MVNDLHVMPDHADQGPGDFPRVSRLRGARVRRWAALAAVAFAAGFAPSARAQSDADAAAGRPPARTGPADAGDRVFTVGDRVKSVQKRLILKEGRLELAPAFSISLNDPFFQKGGAGLAATWWLGENLGLFADVYYLTTFETENVRLAKSAFTSTLLESRLKFLAMGGFQWSPVYGKVSWKGEDIVHFDLFFSAGLGMVSTSTGQHVATSFGVGERFLVNRWLALFFKVEDRLFPETYSLKAGPVTSINNVLTLSFGASVFLPLDFEYSAQ